MRHCTRGLAREVGPLGIRVNGIAPGVVSGRLHDACTPPERRPTMVGMTPPRREGTPLDVAGAALFLGSAHAAFLFGETIEANGGCGLR